MEHTDENLTRLDDAALSELAARIADEQRRRAREQGDIDTIVADAFDTLFDQAGAAKNPKIVGNIVLCPGNLTGNGKAAGNHDCVFCHITGEDGDGHWVFEHPDLIIDSIRHTTVRGNAVQQSITVIPAIDGMRISRIGSKARGGKHERKSNTTWAVTGGQLVESHPAPTPKRQAR